MTVAGKQKSAGKIRGIAEMICRYLTGPRFRQRVEATYQHAVLQFLSGQTLTNTTLRERFKLIDKQRNSITNLIADTLRLGRIKSKDENSGNKVV